MTGAVSGLRRRARLGGDGLAVDRRHDRPPAGLRSEPIREYLTTDHVTVEDDYSDTQLAEIFLHHRVLIVPIATAGRVHAVVTRSDFYAELVGKLESAGSRP